MIYCSDRGKIKARDNKYNAHIQHSFPFIDVYRKYFPRIYFPVNANTRTFTRTFTRSFTRKTF